MLYFFNLIADHNSLINELHHSRSGGKNILLSIYDYSICVDIGGIRFASTSGIRIVSNPYGSTCMSNRQIEQEIKDILE